MISSYTSRRVIFILISLFFLACSTAEKKDFIYIEEKQLMQNGEKFFPVLINYVVAIHQNNEQFFIGPSIDYDKKKAIKYPNEELAHNRLRVHFKAIKQMGFNSIRMVGLNQFKYEEHYTASVAKWEYFDQSMVRNTADVVGLYDKIFPSLDKVVAIAAEMDIKLMILLPRPRKAEEENRVRLNYIEKILKRYESESTVFAYDFFNEPIYFDNAEFKEFSKVFRDKRDARRLVSQWRLLMEKNAPNQLFTISFAEPIEVFEWDPSILDIDFVSIHTYHPLRVPNEIYWFSKYIDKPWIISETSLPAENDSISYEDQAIFMKETLQRTINCGAAGFGWWQYQDVAWGPFEHNYTAIVNLEGKTLIGEDTIYGTIKPAAKELQNFDFKKRGDCDCHVNYYNMLAYENYLIRGKVVEFESGEPVDGAVIRGWNQYWNIGVNTFTNEKGEFTLYSNAECVHFRVSAPGLENQKFDLKIEYKKTPDFPESGLKNTQLEYHNIHFQNYMKEESIGKSVFDFDPKYFDKHKKEGEMHVIELKKIL